MATGPTLAPFITDLPSAIAATPPSTFAQFVGGDDYQAVQAGGVAEYQVSPAVRLIGVVGGKADNRDDAPSVFPYFKLEFVALPTLF